MADYTVQDLQDNLNYLNETKRVIKEAIKEKGQPITDKDTFRSYADKITNIETGIDTSDATATAEDIMQGKTAYIDGEKITGSIITQTEVDTNLESFKELINLTSYTGYQINDYDLNNNLFVRNNDTVSIQIGRIENNNINQVSKTISNTTLNNTIGTVYITDVKFSKVYDENYIKLFVSTRECKSGQNYPAYGCIYLLKLNKETLEIEYKYRTYYENYLDGDTTINWAKRGALLVHPLKDVAVCIFFGTANGVKMRYMASKYNINTDSFTMILGNSQNCAFANNAKFVNSYITNDGYAVYTYGTNSTNYETTIFKINNDDTVSFVTKLSSMRWYTNNGTYITDTGLYSISGTKIKDIKLDGLTGASNVLLLDNLFIYSNRTNGTQTSSTIKMADTNNANLIQLDMTLQEKHPIFYIEDTTIIISNPGNTSVNLYKTSDKIVTAITYRSNNYYSGLKNTATADNLLIGKTAISKGEEIIGTMPNNGRLNYTPSDNAQTIPAGYTSGGTISAVNITTLEDYKTCEAIADNILGDTKPYIELQYVKGTGTQYINTGYTPNANTKVEVKANIVVTPTKHWEVLFGSRPSYQNSDFSFATSYQNGAKMVLGYGTNAELGRTYPASGKDAIIKLDKGKLTISVDGEDIYTYTKTGTFTNAIPMYLMSWVSESSTYSREGTAQSNTKLYYCKIWENDELMRNYIPVKDNSGVGALYDLVQNKFYYSESDDDFVAGGVI